MLLIMLLVIMTSCYDKNQHKNNHIMSPFFLYTWILRLKIKFYLSTNKNLSISDISCVCGLELI